MRITVKIMVVDGILGRCLAHDNRERAQIIGGISNLDTSTPQFGSGSQILLTSGLRPVSQVVILNGDVVGQVSGIMPDTPDEAGHL